MKKIEFCHNINCQKASTLEHKSCMDRAVAFVIMWTMSLLHPDKVTVVPPDARSRAVLVEMQYSTSKLGQEISPVGLVLCLAVIELLQQRKCPGQSEWDPKEQPLALLKYYVHKSQRGNRGHFPSQTCLQQGSNINYFQIVLNNCSRKRRAVLAVMEAGICLLPHKGTLHRSPVLTRWLQSPPTSCHFTSSCYHRRR